MDGAAIVAYLPLVLGMPVLVLPVVAAANPRSREHVLGLVALSYLFLALCLTAVLWYNNVDDAQSVLDTAPGWLFGAVILLVWATAAAAVAIVRCRRR